MPTALNSQKCVYNFWLPQNLAKSLLLTGSLTHNVNSRFTHIVCCMYCYCTLTIK